MTQNRERRTNRRMDELWFPCVRRRHGFEATFKFQDDELSEWEIRGKS